LLLEAFVIIIRKYKLLTLSSLLYSLAFVGSALFTYHNGFRLETFIACLLPFLILRTLILFFPFYSFMIEKASGKFMRAGRGSALSLWIHLGFYDLATMLIIWIDKFIISLVTNEETAAVYFNGTFSIPFLPIVLSAVSSATLMQLTQSASAVEKAHLMQQVGKVLSCAAYPLFFFLLVYREEFVLTVFSEQYRASIPIFLCSILILPVRAYSNTIILQYRFDPRFCNCSYTFLSAVLMARTGWRGIEFCDQHLCSIFILPLSFGQTATGVHVEPDTLKELAYKSFIFRNINYHPPHVASTFGSLDEFGNICYYMRFHGHYYFKT
jgi:O-antigen/teichoic acid export membrane protein